MGCMNIATFLARNPEIKPAGVIFGAPFFQYHQMNDVTLGRQILVRLLRSLGDELVINPIVRAHWVCSDKMYWRRLNELDGT